MSHQFDPQSEEFFFGDPYETYRWLRDEAPLYYNETAKFWAVSRYEDVIRGYVDWASLTSTRGVSIEINPDQITAGSLLVNDPPEHTRLRKLVSRAFTPTAAMSYEPMVRHIIGSVLDRLDGRTGFDAVTEAAGLFPIEIISTLLGIPPEDRRQLKQWVEQRLTIEPGGFGRSPAGLEASAAAFEYFGELVAERRRRPADDMITRLCRVGREKGATDKPLTDDEVVGCVRQLSSGGSETVTKLIANALVLFGRHREQWSKLVADQSLISGALEEVLRYWPPVQYNGRWTLRPVTFEGGTVPANERVVLVIGAASRDPRQFENPDSFDITRPPHMQIAFGFGIHVCLGAHLARLEARVFFEEVCRRWPRFRVDEDNLRRVHMENVYGFSHVPLSVA